MRRVEELAPGENSTFNLYIFLNNLTFKFLDENYISFVDVAAILGGTVTLTCYISGTSFGWNKYNNNKWGPLSTDVRYQGRITAHLTITKFKTFDVGFYRCYAHDRYQQFQGYGSNIKVTLKGK